MPPDVTSSSSNPHCTRAHRYRAQPRHRTPAQGAPASQSEPTDPENPAPSSGNLGPRRRRVVNHARLRAPSGPAHQSAPAAESDDATTRRELVAQRWERPWRGVGRTLEAIGRHGWIEVSSAVAVEWSGVECVVFLPFPPFSFGLYGEARIG
jgi:hypothetical protein